MNDSDARYRFTKKIGSSVPKQVNGMMVTDVTIYPIIRDGTNRNSKLIAFAKVVLNDQFIIHGIRVYKSDKGPFMTFPQDYNNKNKDGKPYSICHPTTSELRNIINDNVLNECDLSPELFEDN